MSTRVCEWYENEPSRFQLYTGKMIKNHGWTLCMVSTVNNECSSCWRVRQVRPDTTFRCGWLDIFLWSNDSGICQKRLNGIKKNVIGGGCWAWKLRGTVWSYMLRIRPWYALSREYLPIICLPSTYRRALSLPWTALLLPRRCRDMYKTPEQWPSLCWAFRAAVWSCGSFSGLPCLLCQGCSARLLDTLWSFEVQSRPNATAGFWCLTAMPLICTKINRKPNWFYS